jgi:hypothetical protein
VLAQSQTIGQYLAQKQGNEKYTTTEFIHSKCYNSLTGLAGATLIDSAKCDMLVAGCMDLYEQYKPYMWAQRVQRNQQEAV